MIGFLKNAWRGQSKLWKVFWLMGLLFIIPTVVVMIALPMVFGGLIGLVLIVVWFLFITGYYYVCVWKCAFNCRWRGWGYIARVIVVLNALGFIAQIAMVGMAMMFVGSMASAMKHMESEMNQPGMAQFGDPSASAVLPSNLEEAMKELEALNSQMESEFEGLEAVMQEAEQKINTIEAQDEAVPVSINEGGVSSGASLVAEGSVGSTSSDVASVTGVGNDLAAKCESHFNAEYEARGIDVEGAIQERDAYVASCVPVLEAQLNAQEGGQ